MLIWSIPACRLVQTDKIKQILIHWWAKLYQFPRDFELSGWRSRGWICFELSPWWRVLSTGKGTQANVHLVCLQGAVCRLGLCSVLPTLLQQTGHAAPAAHSPVPAGIGSFKPPSPKGLKSPTNVWYKWFKEYKGGEMLKITPFDSKKWSWIWTPFISAPPCKQLCSWPA